MQLTPKCSGVFQSKTPSSLLLAMVSLLHSSSTDHGAISGTLLHPTSGIKIGK